MQNFQLGFDDDKAGQQKQVESCVDEKEFRRVLRALDMIQACNLEIVGAKDELTLIRNICRKIVEIGGYRFAWFGHIENDARQTVRPSAMAGSDDGYLDHIDIALNDPELKLGPSGRALISRQIYTCRNIMTDPDFKPWREAALQRGFHSSIAIPILNAQDELFGVMNIYSSEADVFANDEVNILTQMVQDLSVGISSLRNYLAKLSATETLERNLAQIKRIMYQTVSSLSKVLEFRDPYTAGHQRNVTNLAVSIARIMGLSEDQIDEIFIAASLHDIGKISVPTEILSKPGKISAIELGIIQNHSQIGYEMVREIEFPWPIADIILQHHEKYDGSGYPNGLKGEEILLPARIIGLADVIEAMASDRPYRPSLGINAALAEILAQKGIYFDPRVVDACFELFSDIDFHFNDSDEMDLLT